MRSRYLALALLAAGTYDIAQADAAPPSGLQASVSAELQRDRWTYGYSGSTVRHLRQLTFGRDGQAYFATGRRSHAARGPAAPLKGTATGAYRVTPDGAVVVRYQNVEHVRTFGLTRGRGTDIWPALSFRDVAGAGRGFVHHNRATSLTGPKRRSVVRSEVRFAKPVSTLETAGCRAEVDVDVEIRAGRARPLKERRRWRDVPCEVERRADLVVISLAGCRRDRVLEATTCWWLTQDKPSTKRPTEVTDALRGSFTGMLAYHPKQPNVLFALESHSVGWARFWTRSMRPPPTGPKP